MRVLCTGDLHIGRRSTRLPASVDASTVSCASAWAVIVDHAIDQRVDLVAISGDLVDQANRFYESLGPLERGLRRLREAAIDVVAVAGNHDHDVLPDLARSLPAGCLTLLGVGGRWERTTIQRANGARLHVTGWSFPTQHVRASPLASYRAPDASDAPVLGLVHADLDAPGSAYAPVALADLHRAGGDLWLLGHVHTPRVREVANRPAVLYPGSPHPMDPGECGAHGVWIVEFARGERPTIRQVALASVRYDEVTVDLTDVHDLSVARTRVVDAVRLAADEAAIGSDRLRHLRLRVRLTGRCTLHRMLVDEASRITADLELEAGPVSVTVERVDNLTRAPRDLEQLASGRDAASVLARLLQDLERGNDVSAHPGLAHLLSAIPITIGGARAFDSLDTDPTLRDGRALREAVAGQANLLLDTLLEQREAVQ